jgi:hypothetical protein
MSHGVLAAAALALFVVAYPQAPDLSEQPQGLVAGRLAHTPVLDGKLSEREWDPFMRGEGLNSYLQWDWDALYLAATLPAGKHLLISLDGRGDGWLVGADNVEIAVSSTGGAAVTRARLLDASNVAGPRWEPAGLIEKALRAVAAPDGLNWTVEMRIPSTLAVGLEVKDGARMAARFDPLDETALEPHFPRACAPFALVMDKGFNVPDGVTWKPNFRARRMQAGAGIHMGFEIANAGPGALNLRRIKFSGYGETDRWVDQVERAVDPVPAGTKAKFDYDTKTSTEIPPGFHTVIVGCELADGSSLQALCSFEVLPLITFEWGLPEVVEMGPGDTSVSGWVRIRNNSSKRINSAFDMSLPPGWQLKRGEGKRFVLYGPADKFRVGVEIVIPGGTVGVYRLESLAKFLTGNLSDVRWVDVRAPGD